MIGEFRSNLVHIGALLNPFINLVRNTDLVKTNSIDAIDISGTVYLVATITPGDWIINKIKTDKIRQSDTLTQIRLHINILTGMDKIWFYVWRKNGTNYDVVGKEEIKAKLSTGIQTITLTTPIEVLEGDYTGAMYKAVSANINVVLGSSHANGCIAQYTTTPTETNYNWDGIGGQQVAQHIFTYAQAPLIVGIGDSIMESYPLHSSYVDPNFTYDDLTKSWLYKLAQKDTRLVVQNCGQGGKTTTQIKAYFDEYVIAAKPKICILNGGINDIDGGATTKAQFLANITEMLDKCITNSIVPVVFSIGPWTLATTLKMQTRDAWNIDFKALVLSYPKAKFIEWDNLLGQFRTGGDAGNKWDVIPAYNSGGCHYNEAGNVVIADEVYRVLTH